MPLIKRILWVIVFVIFVPVAYVMTASITYNFTDSKAIDVVVATIVALLAIIGFEKVGKFARVIAMTVILGLSALILTGNAGASTKPTTESRASGTPAAVADFSIPIPPIAFPSTFPFWKYKFGGYDWSPSVTRNLGYATVPSSYRFHVWVNGFAPVGTYTDDTFGLIMHWSGASTLVKGRFGPNLSWRFSKRPTFRWTFKGKPTAHFERLIQTVARYQGCYIKNVWTPKGCYYVRLTAEVTHSVPPAFISIITGYPSISVIVNARGSVVLPWYSLDPLQF